MESTITYNVTLRGGIGAGDLGQISHCIIKGLSVGEFKRIENMITQVKFS